MKPSILEHGISYPIEDFTWTGHHGSCEISKLEGIHRPVFCHLGRGDDWNEGFIVRGNTRNITFVLKNFAKDLETGEYLWWDLRSVSEPGFSITVYND